MSQWCSGSSSLLAEVCGLSVLGGLACPVLKVPLPQSRAEAFNPGGWSVEELGLMKGLGLRERPTLDAGPS